LAVGLVVDRPLGPAVAVLVEQLAAPAVALVHPAVRAAVAVAVLDGVGGRGARGGRGGPQVARGAVGGRGGGAQRLELLGDRERGAGAGVGRAARGLLLADLLLHRLLLRALRGELRLLRAVVGLARHRHAGLLLDALVGAPAEGLVALRVHGAVQLDERVGDDGERPEEGVAPERILAAADLARVDGGRAAQHLGLRRRNRVARGRAGHGLDLGRSRNRVARWRAAHPGHARVAAAVASGSAGAAGRDALLPVAGHGGGRRAGRDDRRGGESGRAACRESVEL